MIRKPLIAGVHGIVRRLEFGADVFALRHADQYVLFAPPGNDGVRPGTGGAFGGENLRNHSALTHDGGGPSGHLFESRVSGFRVRDKAGRRILSGVGGVKPLLVGENHERVGFHEIRNERPQGVVVPNLNFVRDDRVVFVDDWENAET